MFLSNALNPLTYKQHFQPLYSFLTEIIYCANLTKVYIFPKYYKLWFCGTFICQYLSFVKVLSADDLKETERTRSDHYTVIFSGEQLTNI